MYILNYTYIRTKYHIQTTSTVRGGSVIEREREREWKYIISIIKDVLFSINLEIEHTDWWRILHIKKFSLFIILKILFTHIKYVLS